MRRLTFANHNQSGLRYKPPELQAAGDLGRREGTLVLKSCSVSTVNTASVVGRVLGRRDCSVL